MNRSKGWKAIGVVAVALLGAVVAGVVPRLEERKALARVEKELAGPRRVRVALVRAGEARADVTLPGTSAPFRTSVLYAKSTGYVRKNAVDVGDRVKAGQLLAEIDTPENAEEIRLAQARLGEAEANVEIMKSTSERQAKLAAVGIASQQQADDARANANSAIAAVATRRAELARLVVVRGYQQIVAPFAGVVTRRGTDPGALVGPAGPGSAALFEIADVELMRVTFDVPDAWAGDVKPGVEAKVFSPRDPSRKVAGKVALTSGVLEQATRTLRAEVHVPGAGGPLPGAFVYVELALPRARPAPVVPASALVVRKEGTLVARVDAANHVSMVRVTIGRDFGKEVEVLEGLSVGEQAVINGPDDLEAGQSVEIVR